MEQTGRKALPYVNFNQLRSFHAVAQEMSFTRAASVLHVGQSTLTVQVRALEETYGVELFVRSSRGLRLSRTGETLFAITRGIFDLEEQAVELLRATGDAVAGRLRVATVGPLFVMKLIAQYQARYPLVQVSIETDNTEGVVRKILASAADVGITGNPPEDPRLSAIPLKSHEILLCVHRQHPFASRADIELAELAGEGMITREPGSMTRAAFEATLAAHGVRPRIVMEVSRDSVREAVIEGLGMGLVSQAEFQPHESLRALRVRDFPSFTHSYVVCLASRRHSKPIALFAGLAQEIQPGAAA